MEKEPKQPTEEQESAEPRESETGSTPEAGEVSFESAWREDLAESKKVADQVGEMTEMMGRLDTPEAPMASDDRAEMEENQDEAAALVQAEEELGQEIQEGKADDTKAGGLKASIGELLAAKMKPAPEAGQRQIKPSEGVRGEDVAAAAGVEMPKRAEPEIGGQRVYPFEGARGKESPKPAESVAAAAEAPKPAGDWKQKAAEHADELMDRFAAEDEQAEQEAKPQAEPVKDSAAATEAAGTIESAEKPSEDYFELGKSVAVEAEFQKEAEAVQAKEAEAVQAAKAEEAARAELAEKEKQEAAEKAHSAMEKAGSRIAQLAAKLKKYEGLGVARLISGKGRQERDSLQNELEEAKQEYSELRVEAVGENLKSALDERMSQAERMREALEQEKGLSGKVYDAYKKLGEINLTKLGWKPKGRLGQMVARAASARTAISMGLLGGGLALGGMTAAGLGAFGLRRLMGSLGAGVGSYDLMRLVADRRAGKFEPDDLEKMEESEVVERMAKLEARAAAGGASLQGNEAYDQLRQQYTKIHEPSAAELAAGKSFSQMSAEEQREMVADQQTETAEKPAEVTGRIAALMESADAELAERAKKDKRNDRIMKGVATGLAAAVGSGGLAKGIGWVSEQGGLSGAYRSAKEAMSQWLGLESAPTAGAGAGAPAAEAAPEAPGPAAAAEAAPEAPKAGAPFPSEEATRSPESLAKDAKLAELAQVQKGDNYYRIIGRQLEADPERFGYDPATDGEVDKWAKKMTGQIVRENRLIGQGWDQRLRFDPNNPGSVELKYDPASGKFNLDQSAESYRHTQPDPDQILKESVEATRAEMAETAPAEPAEFKPKEPAWAKEALSPQDQMRATAKAWQEAGITKDSLEKLVSATEGQKEVVLNTADGKALRVPVDIESKRAAVEALEQMEKGGVPAAAAEAAPEAAPKAAPEAGEAKPFSFEQAGDTGKKWINEGVTRESLEKVAREPAIGGEMKTLKTVDGRTIVVEGGTEAKLAANAALEQLDAREAAAAASQQATEAAPEAPSAEKTVDAKDMLRGVYSEQQKAYGKSLLERGVTKESLQQLANAPSRGGQFMDVKTADGGTLRVPADFDGVKAAQSALEQMEGGGASAAAETAAESVPSAEPAEAIPPAESAPMDEAAESKEIFGDFYTDQQKALGKSWIDRGVTKESLEGLANAPARGGEFLDLKTADGGTVRVAGGFDAQRAAKAALEQLKNQGR